jgi:hypothetical protein
MFFLLDSATMRRTLVLVLSLGTSACGLFFPEDSGDEDGTPTAEDVYVAVGDAGALLSSPDGETWTVRTSGTDLGLYDVAHGNNTFVAVGQAGEILSSSDGVTWAPASSPSSRDLKAVVHHIDRFFAVGGDFSVGAETLVSSDGITWTRPEFPAPLYVLTGLASDGTDLVATGSYQSDLQTFGLFAWVEGTGWVQRIDSTGTGFRYEAVAAGSPSFVLIGPGSAANSNDTITWISAPIFQMETMRGLTFTPQGWLAVGDAGMTMRSADAAQWLPGPSGVAVELRDVTSDGAIHVAVGADGTITASADGVDWRAQISPVTAGLHAVTHPRS